MHPVAEPEHDSRAVGRDFGSLPRTRTGMAKLTVRRHDAWALGTPDESDIVENDSIDELERGRVNRRFMGTVRALAEHEQLAAGVDAGHVDRPALLIQDCEEQRNGRATGQAGQRRLPPVSAQLEHAPSLDQAQLRRRATWL